MLQGLIELVLEKLLRREDDGLPYDRCQRCATDIRVELTQQEKRCRHCGRRIRRPQHKMWERFEA